MTVYAFTSQHSISTHAAVGSSYPTAANIAEDMYIDLLKRAVLNFLYQCHPPELNCVSTLENPNSGYVEAASMIGLNGLTLVETFLKDIIHERIMGDVIETGVYKGGTSIFMRGVLSVLGANERVVYVADSFQGIPEVDKNMYPDDAVHEGSENILIPVTMEKVRDNFFQFGVLGTNVKFLKGWFKDTLPSAGFQTRKLALVRLDGDLFESTWDALSNIYEHISPRGYIIIDDYGDWDGCRLAVDFFRKICGETNRLLLWPGVTTPTQNQEQKFATWRKTTECNMSKAEMDARLTQIQASAGGVKGFVSK